MAIEEYVPLQSQDDFEDPLLGGDDKELPSRKSYHDKLSSPIFLACFVVTALCTVVNISLWFNPSKSSETTRFIPSAASQRLEFVSPYIGLDSAVYRPDSPRLPPILNFPTLLTQINSSDPSRNYGDIHKWTSSFGLVYPEDRRVRVDHEVSTVVQFRVLDWGMEHCTVNVAIPPREEMEDYMDFSIVDGDSATIDIWMLEGREDLREHTLTWRNRPKRVILHDTWTVKPGSILESKRFDCPSMSSQVFEFSCGGAACDITFRQDPKEPGLAFFLRQYQSDR